MRRLFPIMVTTAVFVVGFILCSLQFPNFASTRVVANLLTDNAFLGIVAVGMTFVIIAGQIDLSWRSSAMRSRPSPPSPSSW